MAKTTIADLSKMMADIDFATMSTTAVTGGITSRPMSNNRDVEFQGDAYFFAYDTSAKIAEIERDSATSLSYAGSKGLLAGTPIFIAVKGHSTLIRDKAEFAAHWTEELDRWFPQSIDTPGVILIKVHASHIRYWVGEEQGEITV
ncbi:pyridoxamine 5'-phosphate oxidase [Pseudoroseomonas deserti]|uniref:Pyridoxamine 5'-phosphate oxidase n=2 Tax=Teichococcus deserti TaxID=1817963 RepID=A0A1V2H8L4_9PROT|nr:pyridoxamine 5'-phosphate oxidase [Pseudoroseomonas deserti]